MIPVFILVQDLRNDILQCLVGSFGLSISLRVICCGTDVLYLVLLVQDLMKLVDKLCSTIGSNLCWCPEAADNLSMEELGNGLGIGFWKGLGFDPFGEKVNCHDNISVAL